MTLNTSVNMYGQTPISGNKAIKALDKYIRKIEKHKTKTLTEKQAYALIKTAKAIRNTISQN